MVEKTWLNWLASINGCWMAACACGVWLHSLPGRASCGLPEEEHAPLRHTIKERNIEKLKLKPTNGLVVVRMFDAHNFSESKKSL